MPKIDFYVLSASGAGACYRFACRLTEKAYRLSHRVHLHADDATTVGQLDELLWTFRDGSFVPHEILSAQEPAAPVTIGYGEELPQEPDLLISLTSDVAPFAHQFQRVAEVVDGDLERRQASRRRFARYRDAGFPIESHTIA